MTVLAPLYARPRVARQARYSRDGLVVRLARMDLTALGRAIERLEAREDGPALEAAIFRALGWDARGPQSPRGPWQVRGPLSLTWIAQPPVTRCTDGAAILVPPGWDHGCGMRRGHAFAWCRRNETRWTETTCGTRARALCRAALHAWRHILLEDE
jgi:hypothetical protein